MNSYCRPLFAFLPLTLGLAVTSVAGPAFASSTYPGEIQNKLGIQSPPLCTICHKDLNGGSGTVIQAFGQTMINTYGLTGGSATDLLDDALDKSAADKKDSDGDGQTDVDELKAGTNPSQAGGGAVTPAKYGCFETTGTIAATVPASPRLASLAIAALVGGVLFLRRRRR